MWELTENSLTTVHGTLGAVAEDHDPANSTQRVYGGVDREGNVQQNE